MKPPLRTLIKPYLADLCARKITGRQVARDLGITESWVSKTLKEMGVEREKPESRAAKRELRDARLAHREKVAKLLPVVDAAKAANVHPRTITRLLKKLSKAKA